MTWAWKEIGIEVRPEPDDEAPVESVSWAGWAGFLLLGASVAAMACGVYWLAQQAVRALGGLR